MGEEKGPSLCGLHPFPEHGEVMGWIVFTASPDGKWSPDWDGELHVTFEAAQQAIRAASEGSCCVLGQVRRVAVNPPLTGRADS